MIDLSRSYVRFGVIGLTIVHLKYKINTLTFNSLNGDNALNLKMVDLDTHFLLLPLPMKNYRGFSKPPLK